MLSEVVLTKMSSKGQIVIPKRLRDIFGYNKGEIFAMIGNEDTLILKKVAVPSSDELERLFKWGEEFTKRKRIKKEDVLKAIQEVRHEGG
ncbi:MAG: AbrB family transcriptional regulator [Methanosarcinales archaeon]|uniref:AbrB family transcriptional regulator n=1 Tax=Candidatus Ethanoperedens thermophilum TaxID=2766897 RepID=A0A848D9S9_9EURY|nr:AbrB family transcriptional regulator [Candidatus Ethanoperedens thermophilum]